MLCGEEWKVLSKESEFLKEEDYRRSMEVVVDLRVDQVVHKEVDQVE